MTESLTAAERETTVTTTDDDKLTTIWTCRRKHLTRLRKHPSFTEVASGFHGTTEWAEFTIPSDDWNPASGAKRRTNMSPEARKAAAERLRRVRNSE